MRAAGGREACVVNAVFCGPLQLFTLVLALLGAFGPLGGKSPQWTFLAGQQRLHDANCTTITTRHVPLTVQGPGNGTMVWCGCRQLAPETRTRSLLVLLPLLCRCFSGRQLVP